MAPPPVVRPEGSEDPDATQAVGAPRDRAPGRVVFGRFTLLEGPRRGGMGEVWRARDGLLQREVALKFLPETAVAAGALADLKRETKRALELSHPNIVRVYDYFDDGRDTAIAMEFVDGGSVADRREAQPDRCIEPGQLLAWLRQIAPALDYAHRKVVHRDLKPANLLLTADDQIRISDFGIAASLVDTQTRLAVPAGTVSYMSPQQAHGDAPAPSDDIYALGATLYDLLTGKPPYFRGDVRLQLSSATIRPAPLAQRRDELGIKRPPLPPQWDAAITSCLDKNPARRPKNAAILLAWIETGIKPAEAHVEDVDATIALPCDPDATVAIAGVAAPPPPPDVVAQHIVPAAAATPLRPKRTPDTLVPPSPPATPPLSRPEPLPTSKSRVGTWLALGATVVLLAIALIWFVQRERPSSASRDLVETKHDAPRVAPAPTPATAQLEISSTPAGAEILLTDRPVGRTPLTLRGIDAGADIAVTARLEGYREFSSLIRLEPGTTRRLPIAMEPLVGTILLHILPADVQREGVRVALDEKATAVANGALRLSGVAAGDHTLEVTHPDYLTWRGKVTVADARESLVDVVLQPAPGTIKVTSVPSGASVVIESGPVVGKSPGTTPWQDSLPPGRYTLRLELKGFLPETRSVVLAANQPVEVEVPLRVPRPEAGKPWENSLGMRFAPVGGTASAAGVSLLAAIWETRVRDYQAFATATKRAMNRPDNSGGADLPVVTISRLDAQAFCRWLTEKERAEGRLGERQEYRLPTGREWSTFAVQDDRAVGRTWPPKEIVGNLADESARRGRFPTWTVIEGYDDGFDGLAPVGRFPASKEGLFDLVGNVSEWVADGGARGASFNSYASEALAAGYRLQTETPAATIGFRCLLELK